MSTYSIDETGTISAGNRSLQFARDAEGNLILDCPMLGAYEHDTLMGLVARDDMQAWLDRQPVTLIPVQRVAGGRAVLEAADA